MFAALVSLLRGRSVAVWSSGMIPLSGRGGQGFNSPNSPFFHSRYNLNVLIWRKCFEFPSGLVVALGVVSLQASGIKSGMIPNLCRENLIEHSRKQYDRFFYHTFYFLKTRPRDREHRSVFYAFGRSTWRRPRRVAAAVVWGAALWNYPMS